MKGIQNKKFTSRKLIVIHVSRLCHQKGKLKVFFSCPAYAHANFTVDMLERTDVSPDFLRQVCFSNKAMFHINGIVNMCIQLQGFGAVNIHMPHVRWRGVAPK
jgi:hypothetical protein